MICIKLDNKIVSTPIYVISCYIRQLDSIHEKR